MLRHLIALCEGASRCEQQPRTTCSFLILESSRPHDARTPPGSVVPGGRSLRRRSILLRMAVLARSTDFVKCWTSEVDFYSLVGLSLYSFD
jgi:hypothetical protein